MELREAEQWEKDWIRSELEQAVADKASAERLSEMRRQFAELLGLTLAQVKSIGAWKRKPDQEKLVLEPTLILNMEQETLQENSRSLESNAQRIKMEMDSETSDIYLSEKPLMSQTTSNSNVTVHPKSGAWTDYEHSAIKEQWREAEMRFFDSHRESMRKKPEEMNVLCTPGIKCYLEVRHLLARGIKPEHIFAVERERGAWSEFEKNCHELGIRPIYGDMKELLPTINTQFDVVMLDFLGPFCVSNLEIIHKLPVSDSAIVAINVMAKREQSFIQENLAWLQRNRDGTRQRELGLVARKKLQDAINGNAKHPMDILSETYDEVDEWEDSQEYDISGEVRDTALWYSLARVGCERPDSWSMPNLILNMPSITMEEFNNIRTEHKVNLTENFLRVKLIDEVVGLFTDRTLAEIEAVLHSIFRTSDDQCLNKLRELVTTVAFGEKKIVDLEKYEYLSKVGQTSSPFYTNLALLERPTDQCKEMRHSAQFVLNCARAILSNSVASFRGQAEKDCFVELEDKYRNSLSLQNRIVFYHGKKRVDSIQLSHLLADLSAHAQLMKNYPLSEYKNAKKIERIRIQ